MKKFTLKALALLMVLLMVLPVLFACVETPEETKGEEGTKAPEQAETNAPGGETEGNGETESETVIETEPDPDEVYTKDPANYLSQYRPAEREEITFHARDNGTGVDYEAQSNTGDVLESAIYARNITLEEQLNVTLKFIYSDKNDEYWTKFTTDYEAEANSTYDALNGRAQDVVLLGLNGYVEDLNQYSQFNNFETSWWNEKLMSELIVNNKRYFVTGDMSIALLWGMGVTHVNLEIAEQYQITKQDLYNHVKNKTWTTDVMYNYAKDVYQDLNNDGAKDDGDFFGFSLNNSNAESLRVGANIRILGRDANGKVIVHEDYFSERMVDYMYKLWSNNQANGWHQSTGSTSTVRKIYTQGRSLFQPNRIYTVNKDGRDFDFTLLPNPMAVENQEGGYFSFLSHDVSLYSISNKASNKDLTAATLELFEVLSHNMTTPVLFEVIFQVKIAEDAETAEVFNITKDAAVLELARAIKKYAESDISEYFCDIVVAKTFDTTIWEVFKDTVNGDLDRMNTFYFN